MPNDQDLYHQDLCFVYEEDAGSLDLSWTVYVTFQWLFAQSLQFKMTALSYPSEFNISNILNYFKLLCQTNQLKIQNYTWRKNWYRYFRAFEKNILASWAYSNDPISDSLHCHTIHAHYHTVHIRGLTVGLGLKNRGGGLDKSPLEVPTWPISGRTRLIGFSF